MPKGSTATEVGNEPAAKGEPVIGLKAPVVLLMLYAETLPIPLDQKLLLIL